MGEKKRTHRRRSRLVEVAHHLSAREECRELLELFPECQRRQFAHLSQGSAAGTRAARILSLPHSLSLSVSLPISVSTV